MALKQAKKTIFFGRIQVKMELAYVGGILEENFFNRRDICSFCLEGCIIILYIDGGMQDEKWDWDKHWLSGKGWQDWIKIITRCRIEKAYVNGQTIVKNYRKYSSLQRLLTLVSTIFVRYLFTILLPLECLNCLLSMLQCSSQLT